MRTGRGWYHPTPPIRSHLMPMRWHLVTTPGMRAWKNLSAMSNATDVCKPRPSGITLSRFWRVDGHTPERLAAPLSGAVCICYWRDRADHLQFVVAAQRCHQPWIAGVGVDGAQL